MSARLASAAALALALALAGCDFHEDVTGGGRVLGTTLSVDSVLARSGTPAALELARGERLALALAHGRVGRFTVTFGLQNARAGTPGNTAEAARSALSDPRVIAVVADADRVSVPLFNAAGVLQVAPDGDLALGDDAQLTPAAQRTLAPPAPVPLPADFAERFRAAYARAPTARAVSGFRAMQGVLRAIARAGADGNDRDAVRRAYLAGLPRRVVAAVRTRAPRPG
jgi:hypothetical protein